MAVGLEGVDEAEGARGPVAHRHARPPEPVVVVPVPVPPLPIGRVLIEPTGTIFGPTGKLIEPTGGRRGVQVKPHDVLRDLFVEQHLRPMTEEVM